MVEEGERVHRGQVLVRIKSSQQTARVASTEANLQRQEAELRRLVNGARGPAKTPNPLVVRLFPGRMK